MTREQFIDWAQSKGWKLDSYGHLQNSFPGADGKPRFYRFKLSRVAVRYEVKIVFENVPSYHAKSEWKRLRSGYFSNLTLGEDGKVAGLKR